jgi:urease accessory protein
VSNEALLALLQLSDSSFPSGTFTHSFGLEQLVRDGLVRTPEEVGAFVTSVLALSVATSDAIVARRALLAASEDDLDGIIEADRALHRTRAASELRAASLVIGRRFVEESVLHLDDALLHAYAGRLRLDATLGMQPVAFAVAGSALGVSDEDCVSALLFGCANAILQAAMRLLRFSHRDAQAILHRLRPRMATLARDCLSTNSTRLCAFQPLQEIAAMRHAAAEARMFAS